jgi:hypothetical protein
MPHLLLCIGCFFLGVGVFGLVCFDTSTLDLLCVQALFEQRSFVLNQVTILLSRLGGMPFLLFLTTFLCIYQTWIKNYKNAIFIALSVGGSIVIDVWWLCEQGTAPPTAQALLTRLAIYPASSGQQADTAAAWLDCAQARLSELQAPTAATHVLQDLRRWLPSSWHIGPELVGAMLGLCVQHLGKGMADVRTLPQLVQGVQEPRA